MQVADIGFSQRYRLPREIADIAQRLKMIDRFEMMGSSMADAVVTADTTRSGRGG
jgi:hypothetical protein